MAHKKDESDERDESDTAAAQEHVLATRRIDLAREMMAFAKVAMANVQAMAQPDQDIDPSRY